MNEAQAVAIEALERFKEVIVSTGLGTALRALVRDVWAQNLDRFEPDELGDTARSLGIQCSENLREVAFRRSTRDEREAPENHWGIQGLSVGTPRSVLTLTVHNRRIVPMKVPASHGRAPQFSRFRDWEYESEVRNEMAKRNSAAMGGFTTASLGQPMLIPGTYDLLNIQDFMLLWAGAADSPLTSGYLAVPVKGPEAFAATTALWWDEADVTSRVKRRTPNGPNFDEKGVPAPLISLKLNTAFEGQA